MPAAKIAQHFFGGATHVPAFDGPIALAHADEVEQRPGAQRIMHDVAAGPDPVGADAARDRCRHAFHWDDAAPGYDAAEIWLRRAEQGFAHYRMHAVGADHELCRHRRAGFETQFDVAGGLRKANAFAAQVNGAGLCLQHRLRNHTMQVAAMDGDVGESIALDRFQAEIEQLPALPGVPQPDRLAGRQHLDFLQRVLEPERVKHAGAVGADLYTSAELAQFRRLLVDIDLDAAANERQRGDEPADAAADDRDVVHCRALQVEERNDLADQLALFCELFGRLIAPQRAAGDVDLALLADDDIERLFIVARLRPGQNQLVIDQARFDAARFQRLRRLDGLLEELGQEIARKLVPPPALLILLRALAGKLAKDFVELRHHRMKLTEPSSPSTCASRMARRSAILSRPLWGLSLWRYWPTKT